MKTTDATDLMDMSGGMVDEIDELRVCIAEQKLRLECHVRDEAALRAEVEHKNHLLKLGEEELSRHVGLLDERDALRAEVALHKQAADGYVEHLAILTDRVAELEGALDAILEMNNDCGHDGIHELARAALGGKE